MITVTKKILKPPPGQAMELCQLLMKTVDAYNHEQTELGKPLLLNDILSAQAGAMGTLLAGVPQDLRERLFADLGVMVRVSIDMTLASGDGPQVELVQSVDEKGTGTMQ